MCYLVSDIVLLFVAFINNFAKHKIRKLLMKHLVVIFAFLSLFSRYAYSQTGEILTVRDTIFDRSAYEETFAFGADISWLSQQESWNTVYRNRKGKKEDLMTILKDEQGLNALRFRVWVNPSGGWSGKQDVINLCKRAHAKGFDIMIDFHYSDTWADPGSQTIPAQWQGHTVDQLAQDIYDHTYDVLYSLKSLGIIPKWVQIGNETKRGMLYDVGKTSSTQGYKNFAQFINSGYKAIKDVDESIQAIVHLPDGDDNSLYRSMFDNLKKHGAKWDIIGMSAYPRWSHLEPAEEIRQVIANIKDMKSRYGTPVMIVETGHYNDRPVESNNFLADFFKALIDNGALGAFYWEPEAMSGYELGAWDPVTHQASIAMDAYLGIKHVQVSHYMNVKVTSPIRFTQYEENQEMSMRVMATHEHGTIARLEFYSGDSLIGVDDAKPYNLKTDSLSVGAHNLYAIAYDTHGRLQSSDTVSVIIGKATILQEDSPGLILNIDKTNAVLIADDENGYTGDGYINGQENKKLKAEWYIDVPAAGEYQLAFRYRIPKRGMARLSVDDGENLYKTFLPVSTVRSWLFLTENIKVEKSGVVKIMLSPVGTNSLPNIDFMAVIPLGDSEMVNVADVTDIEKMEMASNNSDALFVECYENDIIIKTAADTSIDELSLSMMDGTVVCEKSFLDKTSYARCSVLHKGVFLLRVKTNRGVMVKKIIVR